jgi:hypothetical protein
LLYLLAGGYICLLNECRVNGSKKVSMSDCMNVFCIPKVNKNMKEKGFRLLGSNIFFNGKQIKRY